ncbi:MAG TPA: IclR family transcriptional regulator [Geobacteraceae bacterium]
MEKTNYLIKTVLHALDILEQFHSNVDELGVTELSKRLKLHKNNVFRLLATLESRNFIEQNVSTHNYRLGLKNLELGQAVLKQLGLQRQSRQVLETLALECNETCYLAVMRGEHTVYLDASESSQPVRVVPRVGIMLPLHCTAAGKLFLAALPENLLQRYLPPKALRRHAPKSITSRPELARQLETVAVQGYAIEDEELDAGVRGIAVAIRDYSGNAVGAICISGPTMRFSRGRINDELLPRARKAADEISTKLGYCPATAMAENG